MVGLEHLTAGVDHTHAHDVAAAIHRKQVQRNVGILVGVGDVDLRVAQLKKEGKTLSKDDETALLKEITDSYGEQTDPRYAAARLWVDGLIEPTVTREWLALGLEMAANNPYIEDFKSGVFQV